MTMARTRREDKEGKGVMNQMEKLKLLQTEDAEPSASDMVNYLMDRGYKYPRIANVIGVSTWTIHRWRIGAGRPMNIFAKKLEALYNRERNKEGVDQDP
jgi:hypothetical protein